MKNLADQLVTMDVPASEEEEVVAACQGLERQGREGFSKERDQASSQGSSIDGGKQQWL